MCECEAFTVWSRVNIWATDLKHKLVGLAKTELQLQVFSHKSSVTSWIADGNLCLGTVAGWIFWCNRCHFQRAVLRRVNQCRCSFSQIGKWIKKNIFLFPFLGDKRAFNLHEQHMPPASSGLQLRALVWGMTLEWSAAARLRECGKVCFGNWIHSTYRNFLA